jgi:stress response protein SCP2
VSSCRGYWGCCVHSVRWNKVAFEGKQVDLACVLFDDTGAAKETVYYGLMEGRKRTVTQKMDALDAGDVPGADDALIEINLGKMDPVIKALVFTLNTGMGFHLSGCVRACYPPPPR